MGQGIKEFKKATRDVNELERAMDEPPTYSPPPLHRSPSKPRTNESGDSKKDA